MLAFLIVFAGASAIIVLTFQIQVSQESFGVVQGFPDQVFRVWVLSEVQGLGFRALCSRLRCAQDDGVYMDTMSLYFLFCIPPPPPPVKAFVGPSTGGLYTVALGFGALGIHPKH